MLLIAAILEAPAVVVSDSGVVVTDSSVVVIDSSVVVTDSSVVVTDSGVVVRTPGLQSSIEHPSSNLKNLACNPYKPISGASPLNSTSIVVALRITIVAFIF